MFREVLARYNCVDEFGTSYVVLKIQPYEVRRLLSGSETRINGQPYFELADGSRVNEDDEGHFCIVKHNTVIRVI